MATSLCIARSLIGACAPPMLLPAAHGSGPPGSVPPLSGRAFLCRPVEPQKRCYAHSMADLERVLQGLHESEIRCGIQNEPPAGGITAWIDYGSRTEKATFYGTIVGDQQVWPAADRIAAWL